LDRGAVAAIPAETPNQRLLVGVGSAAEAGLVADSSAFGAFNSSTSQVLKRGNAPVVGSVANVGGFQLQWGVWEASEENPATLFTNTEDPTARVAITNPIVVVNSTPTDIAGLNGTKKFDSIAGHLIRARGFDNNQVSSVAGGFTVDLASGGISGGKVEICLGASTCDSSQFGANYWLINFTGNVNSSTSLDTSFSHGESISGVVTAIRNESYGQFLGSSAEGFVLSFSSAGASGADINAATANTAGNADRFVNGAILFNNPASLVFNDADIENINRLGFAIFIPQSSGAQPTSATDGFFFGGANDVSVSNTAFTNTASSFSDNKVTSKFSAILKNQATVQTLVTDVGGFDLDWGIWVSSTGSAATLFEDTFDSTQSQNALGNIVFASAAPADISNYTGFSRFAVTNHLVAGVPAGQTSEVRGTFNLDLANALLNDLRIEVCLGTAGCSNAATIWTSNAVSGVGFSASGGHSFAADLSGEIDVTSSTAEATFSGAFQGVFVGNESTGFGFAAGLRLRENAGVFGGIFGTDPGLLDAAALFKPTNAAVQSGVTSTELASVTRVGTLVGTVNSLRTGSANAFSLASAIYVDDVSASSLPVTFESDFEYLKLSSAAPNNLQSNVGGFDLQWGLWSDSSGQLLNAARFSVGLGDRNIESITETIVATSAKVTDISSLTGQKSFDSISNQLIAVSGFADNSVGAITGSFSVDFGTGIISSGIVDLCVGATSCTTSGFGTDFWRVSFTGSLSGNSLASSTVLPVAVAGGETFAILSNSVGYFVGDEADGFVLSFKSSRGVGTDASSAASNGVSNPDRFVNGAVLFGGAAGATTILAGAATTVGTATGPLSLPELAVVTHGVTWGAWDNPIAENWVVINQVDENLTTLSTQDFIADVNPTAVANMQGSANFESTAASSFIGSGNAGDLSQVVAGMGVDFDTGTISDGSLIVEVGGSQVWNLEFAGSINGGAVELDMTTGQLSDFSGVISNSIDAELGGVFTGNNAEAFVGGFDLSDQLNTVNQVNGIYTINR
jgi:hypothetical protein